MKIEKFSIEKILFFLILTTCHLLCFTARVANRRRIIGGKKTNADELKHVVAVLIGEDLCGGGIINEHYVLSAAHCFVDVFNQFLRGSIVVIAGTDDLYSKENVGRLDRDVENVFVPKSYIYGNYVDDIAVVKLKKSFDTKLNNLTKLVLPPRRWKGNYIGQSAAIAGFGASDIMIENDKMEQVTDGKLYFTDVTVLDEPECPFVDDAKIFCGKMIGDETLTRYGLCFGDSGSPLVYASKLIIGIASYGNDQDNNVCNEKTSNMVYTKVSSYRFFIYNAVTGSNMTEVRSKNNEIQMTNLV